MKQLQLCSFGRQRRPRLEVLVQLHRSREPGVKAGGLGVGRYADNRASSDAAASLSSVAISSAGEGGRESALGPGQEVPLS